jgi:hypothetical protein
MNHRHDDPRIQRVGTVYEEASRVRHLPGGITIVGRPRSLEHVAADAFKALGAAPPSQEDSQYWRHVDEDDLEHENAALNTPDAVTVDKFDRRRYA